MPLYYTEVFTLRDFEARRFSGNLAGIFFVVSM